MTELEKANVPVGDLWGSLLEPAKIRASEAAGERERIRLGAKAIAAMRRRAKTDLFFLSSVILGYDLLSIDLHGHLCRWVEGTRDQQYRLILLPRNHYKSSLITIAESIQMALPNDAGMTAYPYSLGPDIKILLAHENRESASRFLFEIAASFMHNPLMRALFPECIPKNRVQRINKWELELPRNTNHREPTFDTIGARGAAQSRHYHHLKLDDLVGEDARDSSTVMGRVVDWFDNVNSLLTRPKLDGWDLVGTFWSYNDVYAHALDTYGMNKQISVTRNFGKEDVEKTPDGVLAFYGRSMVENDEIIFPEENSWDYVEILRKNPKVFAAQYANNPREAGLTDFKPEWLKYYNQAGNGQLLAFTGDEGDPTRRFNTWELDRMIFVDPSMAESKEADKAGVTVTGTNSSLDIMILDAFKMLLKPDELVRKLFDLNDLWRPRGIVIEEVAFSAIFRYWIQEKARELGKHLPIVPYKLNKGGRKKPKVARIRGLVPYFSSGQIYLQEGFHALRTEYEQFPMNIDDCHILDSLAMGPDSWTRGATSREIETRRRREENALGERSAVTGY